MPGAGPGEVFPSDLRERLGQLGAQGLDFSSGCGDIGSVAFFLPRNIGTKTLPGSSLPSCVVEQKKRTTVTWTL